MIQGTGNSGGGGGAVISGSGQLATSQQGGGQGPQTFAPGSVTAICGQFGVQKGERGLKIERKSMQKAEGAFLEFKTLILEKIQRDKNCPPLDGRTTAVKIDFSTKKVNVTLSTGHPIVFYLTHLQDLRTPGSKDRAIYDAAENFEGVLSQEGVIDGTRHNGPDDEDFDDVLGDYRGKDGLVEAYNGMQPACKDKLVNENQLTIVNDICKIFHPTRNDFSQEQIAMINRYADILAEHNKQQEFLKTKLAGLKADLSASQTASPRTITNSQLVELKNDIKALQKKISEITLTPESKKTLFLTLVVQHLNKESLQQNTTKPRPDQVEEIKENLEKYFKDTLHIGEVIRDPKTKRADIVLTKPYKEYAALIAAAVVYSSESSFQGNNSSRGMDRKEYNQMNKKEYQEFLTKEKINPRSHLGNIGALLRLNGDITANNKDGIDRNHGNLYCPQTLSSSLKTDVKSKISWISYMQYLIRFCSDQQPAGQKNIQQAEADAQSEYDKKGGPALP